MSGAGRHQVLLEIGTEEIPARMVQAAVEELGRTLVEVLSKAGLGSASPRLFATPRRLAVLLDGVASRQADQETEISGPPVAAAYDAQGKPTRAAEGFARAQGVAVSDLKRVRTPKGECVGLRRTIAGRSAVQVLADAIPVVVGGLYFPKTMRWGSGEHRFVRPVHSVVALFDGEVVGTRFAGVASGRATFGHRVAGRERIELALARDYPEALRANGVLADAVERRAEIARQLAAAARAAGGAIATPPGTTPSGADADPELLDEVTEMVEWPLVITGEFDVRFLELPAEILLTSMRHHQKYFALRAPDGTLLNRFLSVANVAQDPKGAIRRGNEWVLKARLADARFFFDEDRKHTLGSLGDALDRVAFHEKLGSYADKRRRVETLAGPLLQAFAASGVRPDADAVRVAAGVAKNDLVTHVVKEFPELQGIVGGLYARADGLPAAVADALYDQYLPRSQDDALPRTAEGAVLSLADRLDTQAGIFLLGIVPTGSRDPYGIRRSVQGACRILIERRVSLSLQGICGAALRGYSGRLPEQAVSEESARAALLEFWTGRQEFLAIEAGLRPESVRAALGAGPDDPYDARRRMEAVDAFRDEAGFADLASAHKRIKNILQGQEAGTPFETARLSDEAERRLAKRVDSVRAGLEGALAAREYARALAAIATLREPLDRFFTEVMVMAEDRAVRANRLALLREIATLITQVADVSLIAPARPGKEA
ncbi:MAG TPA: glycine--tRNA ligase subunit beta [Patescibacteria group bacterium]|nr:glycine--tRNA ligase subunit beta [Patescibacteria group bacterium]